MNATRNFFNPTNNMLVATGIATALAGGMLVGAQPASAATVTFGESADKPSDENSLQQRLDDLTVFGGIDTDNDQTGIEKFTNPDIGDDDSALLMLEVAGWADGNKFGIYDAKDKNNRQVIFDGNGQPKDIAPVDYSSFSEFGFFLESKKDGTFYTQSSLNPDKSQQAVVYEGDGETKFQDEFGGIFEEDEFIIAFEDVLRTGDRPYNDSDFNDMVVKVGSVAAVPEPSAVAALGVVGGLMAFARRRRQ
jgi:hypothetical protein